MGLYSHGRLYDWGQPFALLKYTHLTPWQKLRYGVFAFVCVRRDRWAAIEEESAREWITRWCGKAVYELLWRPLFDHKFYEYAENISAAWIWTRIRRIGRSRKSIVQEELGYLEGGSITLINALVAKIVALGGVVHLGRGAQRILVEDNRVTGVETAAGKVAADAVICTVPTPLLGRLVPDLPVEWKEHFAAIHNIGVICVIFRLRRSVSPHFWVNISEPDLEIPGIIEFTNLRDIGGDTILYVPYYMPVTHTKFSWSDAELEGEAFACLVRVNPMLVKEDIVATKVARLRHGQPICEPGFAARIPPTQTPVAGLQIADTCYYYPEDRGIAESLRLGRRMGGSVGERPKE
jgi:protoporphyrinogen oxidase